MKNKYKILSGMMFLMSALVMIYLLIPSFAAPTEDVYGDFNIIKDDDNLTATITKYNGNDTVVTIPSTINIGGTKYSVMVSGGNTSTALFAGNSTVTKVIFSNGIKAGENLNYLFYNCINLEEIVFNNFNTSLTTSMNGMFFGCKKLTTLNLSKFNTSNVTNMASMFYGCSSLETLNLSSFNTSKVTNMNNLFSGCSKLKNLNVSSFNTSNVTSMIKMFYGCSSIETLDLSNFKTKKVESMSDMFNGCIAMHTLNMSGFTSEKLTNIHSMFYDNRVLKKIYLGHFNFLYQDSTNKKYADNFGRGTWKRLEDGKNYAVVDLMYESGSKDISGTYVWQSNIIDEMAIDYNVTYRIDRGDAIEVDGSLNDNLFMLRNSTLYAKNLHVASTDDYVVPGSAKLILKNAVVDQNKNKYNLRITVDNIHIYDINESVGEDNFAFAIVTLTKDSLALRSYLYTEDLKQKIYINSPSSYDLTFEVVDNNGTVQDGSYIFSASDLDITSTRDGNQSNPHRYSDNEGWGTYSEGIKLIDGFDNSTVKYYSHTLLTRDENRIYGIGYDEDSEFTEFSVKVDARKFKFARTGENCITSVLNYYQPVFVDVIKQDGNGVNLAGAEFELYSGNNLVTSWTSTTEVHTLFLNAGHYTLKETKAPANYNKASDVDFYVDVDGKIIINNDEVSNITLKNTGKNVRVIVKYIDETTNEELTTPVVENKEYGDTYTSSARSFDEYILKRKPSSETVTLLQDETVLIYYYVKVSAGVLEKHIDITDNKILYNETHTGNVGDDYDIPSKTFEGYELVTDRLPNNSKGKMSEELTEVIYYYNKKGKVKIRYIDKTTNEPISEDDFINGYVNDDYNTNPKTIPQYIYTNSEGPTSGKIKSEEQEIIYYYEKVVYITTEVVGGVGTISGDETVLYHNDSTLDNIVIEAGDDYYINRITINGEEIKVIDDEKMILANFTNMEENKHITVEFQPLIKDVPITDMNTFLPIIAGVLLLFGLFFIYLSRKKEKLVLQIDE